MEKQWHVVHVASRTEKKVAERLEKNQITVYLPIQKQLRQWSDRKKWVDAVVVSGYVFAKTNKNEHLKILQTPGVSRFLKHNHVPVWISDAEMQRFQDFIEKANDRQVEFSNKPLPVGTFVTIQNGQFKGISGEIIQHKGKHTLKIQLSHIGDFSIELSIDEVAIQSQDTLTK
ncbi:MAG: UpxY family transcription antiterminator [Bacteroidales bacterium]|nr:UpxY family transcription antiterminator [Bacteroidales bacterium]